MQKTKWWDRMHDLFIQLRTALNSNINAEDFNAIWVKIKAELETLAAELNSESFFEHADLVKYLLHPKTAQLKTRSFSSLWLSKVVAGIGSQWEETKLWLFQRDKLKPTFIHEGIPAPSEASPNAPAF